MTRLLSRQIDPSSLISLKSGAHLPRLQRQCACGSSQAMGGTCADCQKDKLSPGPNLNLQPKLTIGAPDDRFEKEADAIAESILSLPEPHHSVNGGLGTSATQKKSLQKQPAEEEEEELLQLKPKVQRSAQPSPPASAGTAPPVVHQALGQAGNPLDSGTRTFMESRFGHDFSQIRIHSDGTANRAAESVQAKAFTVGNNIVFGQGQFNPGSDSGKKLLAHEITHTLQQEKNTVRRACIDGISFNIGNHPAHTPSCGTVPVRAITSPANIAGLTLSLADGTASVDSGTSIAADGEITVSNAQDAGNIRVEGTCPDQTAFRNLMIASHPTGVTSTRKVGAPAQSNDFYGHVFDHVLTSADSNAASLEGVAIGEHFPGVPNPNAADHPRVPNPFGRFDLHTATLTNNASNNWFATSAGELGGSHDTISFHRDIVDVGRFIASTSNPTPANTLPQSFALDQDLNWYCRMAASGSRWTQFTTLQHTRGLREDSGDINFFTSVNGEEHEEPYTGNPAFQNTKVSSITVSSESVPDPVPTGHDKKFEIRGNALGSTIDEDSGEITVGSTPGNITVRAKDSDTSNNNFDETTVAIP